MCLWMSRGGGGGQSGPVYFGTGSVEVGLSRAPVTVLRLLCARAPRSSRVIQLPASL